MLIPLRDLSVERVRLPEGAAPVKYFVSDRELAALILVGQADVSVSHAGPIIHWRRIGARKSVFDGLPYCVYIGPHTQMTLTPRDGPVDILMASAPVLDSHIMPALIRPEDVKTHVIGEGHYHRMVREVIGGDGIARRLRIGETINDVGGWSSWPMHQFEREPLNATQFEEVFYYLFKPVDANKKPKECMAYQVVRGRYCNGVDVDEIREIRHGDYGVIPLGFHPVIGAVDAKTYYFWAYLSPQSKRYAANAEDIGGYT